MQDEITTEDLLTAWQDAMLAVDVAERLATSALEAAQQVGRGADEAEAIALLAEHAAASAEVVAATARAAADRARQGAGQLHAEGVAAAELALENARAAERSARERWRARTAVGGSDTAGQIAAAGAAATGLEMGPSPAG